MQVRSLTATGKLHLNRDLLRRPCMWQIIRIFHVLILHPRRQRCTTTCPGLSLFSDPRPHHNAGQWHDVAPTKSTTRTIPSSLRKDQFSGLNNLDLNSLRDLPAQNTCRAMLVAWRSDPLHAMGRERLDHSAVCWPETISWRLTCSKDSDDHRDAKREAGMLGQVRQAEHDINPRGRMLPTPWISYGLVINCRTRPGRRAGT